MARYLRDLSEGAGGIAATIRDLYYKLLEELIDYKDRLIEEGCDSEARVVDSLRKNLSEAVENGLDFSQEMLTGMLSVFEDGVTESEYELLEWVNKVLHGFNNVEIQANSSFTELWAMFREALIAMDEDAYVILQSIMDNINQITIQAMHMRETIRDANGEVTGVQHTNNGLVTRTDTSFSEGGVVDYTGPAAVHGSKSNPEIVFNADAAAKLYNYVVNTPDLLKSAFANIAADSSMLKGVSQINNAPNIGDININITGNADADTVLKFKQLAGQLRDEVVKSLNESMNRRGIIRSPRTI